MALQDNCMAREGRGVWLSDKHSFLKRSCLCMCEASNMKPVSVGAPVVPVEYRLQQCCLS
jgi:hypothetical protein